MIPKRRFTLTSITLHALPCFPFTGHSYSARDSLLFSPRANNGQHDVLHFYVQANTDPRYLMQATTTAVPTLTGCWIPPFQRAPTWSACGYPYLDARCSVLPPCQTSYPNSHGAADHPRCAALRIWTLVCPELKLASLAAVTRPWSLIANREMPLALILADVRAHCPCDQKR
jgi:hypothetical protein